MSSFAEQRIGRITVEIADAERDQLFDRPPRPLSQTTAALWARIDRQRREVQAHGNRTTE